LALRNLAGVVFPWFSALEITEAQQAPPQPEAKFRTLVQTSPLAIGRKSASLDERELHRMRPEAGEKPVGKQIPVAVLAEGRFRSAFTAGTLPKGVDVERFRAAQTGDTQSRLLVIGTPYLVSDVLLQRPENAEIFRINQAFLVNLLEAVTGDTDLLAARSRLRSPEYLQEADPVFQAMFKWFHILFLPILVAILGTMRMFRRNRRLGLASTKGAA